MTPITTDRKHLPVKVRDVDDMLSIINEVMPSTAAASNRRIEAMHRACEAGLPMCECCGRGIKRPENATAVLDETGEQIGMLGPECVKKVRATMLRGITP